MRRVPVLLGRLLMLSSSAGGREVREETRSCRFLEA